jgi:hypothetical protein
MYYPNPNDTLVINGIKYTRLETGAMISPWKTEGNIVYCTVIMRVHVKPGLCYFCDGVPTLIVDQFDVRYIKE